MFTGGSQFAFVGIIANGLHAAPAAIAASSMLGIRNGLYALELTHLLGVARAAPGRGRPPDHRRVDRRRGGPGRRTHVRLASGLTGATVFVLWNLTTLAGALIGNLIGDPRTYGLDAAACAAFTALLWPRLAHRDAVAIAVVGAVVAVVLSPTMPPGIPVVGLAAMRNQTSADVARHAGRGRREVRFLPRGRGHQRLPRYNPIRSVTYAGSMFGQVLTARPRRSASCRRAIPHLFARNRAARRQARSPAWSARGRSRALSCRRTRLAGQGRLVLLIMASLNISSARSTWCRCCRWTAGTSPS